MSRMLVLCVLAGVAGCSAENPRKVRTESRQEVRQETLAFADRVVEYDSGLNRVPKAVTVLTKEKFLSLYVDQLQEDVRLILGPYEDYQWVAPFLYKATWRDGPRSIVVIFRDFDNGRGRRLYSKDQTGL